MSVGNLPPNARAIIKIIFVAELLAQGDSLVFELPTNLAPSTAKQALAGNTQVSHVIAAQIFFDLPCLLVKKVSIPRTCLTLPHPEVITAHTCILY